MLYHTAICTQTCPPCVSLDLARSFPDTYPLPENPPTSTGDDEFRVCTCSVCVRARVPDIYWRNVSARLSGTEERCALRLRFRVLGVTSRLAPAATLWDSTAGVSRVEMRKAKSSASNGIQFNIVPRGAVSRLCREAAGLLHASQDCGMRGAAVCGEGGGLCVRYDRFDDGGLPCSS